MNHSTKSKLDGECYRFKGQHSNVPTDRVIHNHQAINTPISEMGEIHHMIQSNLFSCGGSQGTGSSSDNFGLFSEDIHKFDMKISCLTEENNGDIKKRLSCLGLLTSSFFDVHAKVARRGSLFSLGQFSNHTLRVERRGSMASVGTFASVDMVKKVSQDDDESVNSVIEIEQETFGSTIVESAAISMQPSHHESSISVDLQLKYHLVRCRQPDRALTASQNKRFLENFMVSMIRSHQSQQAIHAWDRNMGLKRSHSKTMRLSMRSRKKLKLMIKKDITQITQSI